MQEVPHAITIPLGQMDRDGHHYLTEMDWTQLTEPTFSSQFDSAEWLRATADDDRDAPEEWGKWQMCEPPGRGEIRQRNPGEERFLGMDFPIGQEPLNSFSTEG